MSSANVKFLCPRSLFCINCLLPVKRMFFPNASNFRSNRRIWLILKLVINLDTTYDISNFWLPAFNWDRETTSRIRRWRTVFLGHLSAPYIRKFLSPGLLGLHVFLKRTIELALKFSKSIRCVSAGRLKFLYIMLHHRQQVIFFKSRKVEMSS